MISAIETQYAGCRFRSRLEARWAVFFDQLGVTWEYEPQGYVVPYGDRYASTRGYLPDFWLPELRIWAEVKGSDRPDDLPLLCGATWDVQGLPANPAGDPLNDIDEARGWGNPFLNRNGPRILILGPVPDITAGHPAHKVLHHHKGTVLWSEFSWESDGDVNYQRGDNFILGDCGTWYDLTPALTVCRQGGAVSANLATAYRAARSARFEHGQSGANP